MREEYFIVEEKRRLFLKITKKCILNTRTLMYILKTEKKIVIFNEPRIKKSGLYQSIHQK